MVPPLDDPPPAVVAEVLVVAVFLEELHAVAASASTANTAVARNRV
jgi:hypothetical protein